VAFLASDAFELLRRAHAQDRLAHAYLVAGPEGSGKRKLVRELCGLLVAGNGDDPLRHPDAHVLEPESKSRRIRVEAVRDLERELQLRSLRGGRKVGVIFDAERLVENAANAFLKTLEEPPANSHLFLVSSLPEQLPATIVSRCIKVRLQATARRGPTPVEAELLRALRAFSEHAAPDLPQVFFLARQFQELLGKVKQQIQDENEAALRLEEPLYKQVGNKDALEEREDYFKALTESRYIAERSKLLTILEQWWADALRQHACPDETACAPPPLDHPEFAGITATLARRFTAAELLQKTTALERLRDNLGRNVQEQLAIEVGFLKAFAAPGP
jgi:DNA polymerase-3 subunit delta'